MKSYLFTLCFLATTLLTYAQKLPSATLQTIDNKTVSTKTISSKEGLVVVSFLATWCVPCINELDAISEVFDDWKEEINFTFYAVAIDDARTKNRIRPMVKGKSWPYQVLIDENQDLKRGFNITSMPFVIVLKKGEVVHKHTGYSQGAEEELYNTLKSLSK